MNKKMRESNHAQGTHILLCERTPVSRKPLVSHFTCSFLRSQLVTGHGHCASTGGGWEARQIGPSSAHYTLWRSQKTNTQASFRGWRVNTAKSTRRREGAGTVIKTAFRTNITSLYSQRKGTMGAYCPLDERGLFKMRQWLKTASAKPQNITHKIEKLQQYVVPISITSSRLWEKTIYSSIAAILKR